MQTVAAWLVARPLNAVLALALTLSLMPLGFLSGAVLVYLIVAAGPRSAAVAAGLAAVLLLTLAAILGMPLESRMAAIAMVWLPAALLGFVLGASGSLTMALQVSSIVAVLGVVAFSVAVGDPVAWWTPLLTDLIEQWRQSGGPQAARQAEAVRPHIGQMAEYATPWLAFFAWASSALMLVLGHALHRHGAGAERSLGRFVDLDFGRVIAGATALASLVAFVVGLVWLKGVAFVLFAVFSLQGIALLHWLHAENRVPVFVVVAAYAAIVVLPLIMVAALAVLGYIDAWFSLRRRRESTS